MRFESDHVIESIGPNAYEALYFDEPFNEALCRALAMERHLAQRDVTDTTIVRRVTIRPTRMVPAALKSLLGHRRIEYTEFVEYTWKRLTGRWVLEPAMFAERVQGEGTFVFEAHPKGTRRIISGDLTFDFFGLGALAERAVVAETRRSYDMAARFTNQYVAEHAQWQRQ